MQKQKNNWRMLGTKKMWLMAAMMFFVVVPRPAYAWGDAIPAAILKQGLEKIYDNIQGVILGNLKLLAVQVLNTQIEALVGGVNGSGVLYITNWQQYLYQIPGQANNLYVADLLSQTTRGKCSGLNFQSVATGTFGSNYFTYLCNSARSAVSGGPLFYATIDQYSADPLTSLQEGDWRVFNAMFSNPANNPLGYSLMIQDAQQRDLAARIEAAKAEGIANQGYNSVKVGGVIVTPGRTVGDLIENVKTLGNNILANSDNPSEFLGNLVVSVANRAINQMLQRGFDVARQNIQSQLGKVNQQIFQASNKVNQSLGPASQYIGNVNQVLGTVNSYGRGPATPGAPAATGISCGTPQAGC